MREAVEHGVLAGYPVVDIRITLLDGSYHTVDSSEMAFKVAANQAFQKGCAEAKPVLMEPYYNLDVYCDERVTGDVISDLNSKRGRIMGMQTAEDGRSCIKAQVPYAEILDYAVDLRALTQGTGTFEMKFDHYEDVPPKMAERSLRRPRKRRKISTSWPLAAGSGPFFGSFVAKPSQISYNRKERPNIRVMVGGILFHEKIDQESINTLRFLSIDEVQAANSGHPGLPLGTAPLMYTIWDRFMKVNPKDPSWFDRDRFVLSPGHGSALQYAMLHLAGYKVSLDDLKQFRQWGSLTPGHPEYGVTPGVDVSTGPLGHGFAMAVGLAMAEKMLAARYNKKGFPVVDHYTYGITSDGDQMEGVASEAASLAGTLGLGKLIFLYDDNKITIEGHTDIAFKEDVGARFVAYGWQVLRVSTSEDVEELAKAIKEAKREKNRPSLIIVPTHIGFGSPRQDMASAHGEPLGAENVAATKKAAGWDPEKSFYVPDEVRAHFEERFPRQNEKRLNGKPFLMNTPKNILILQQNWWTA